MAIITADEYRERVARLTPRLFMGGKKVERLTDYPVCKDTPHELRRRM